MNRIYTTDGHGIFNPNQCLYRHAVAVFVTYVRYRLAPALPERWLARKYNPRHLTYSATDLL